MIWFIIFLAPVFLIGGISIYFEKKSGMTTPEESRDALSPVQETFRWD